MVDRIELILLHELKQVGKLHGDQPGRLQQHLEPFDKIIQVRDVSQHVVADDQISIPSFSNQIERRLLSEEGDRRIDPLLLRHFRHIGCRLDPKHRNPSRHEILQQISVITGNLNDFGIAIQSESISDHVDIGLRMGQPRIRKR